ncbi:phosphatidylinositol-specific phospholipase C/glycerophosphodiester phosphodiesterase family protein [Catalinimonas niigatensis]|uniref:phosphatidylinositol-specific phospholipase C/glycerophosphodiester phosphodiesterase family protein n=1 Tax=Catalinimonas niigatensis TaxID=1397264 RepID=UPI0026671C17|nr:phosphatidylinositol-specific phospholipase C/glycerophosphodiester phosphodiesterase family protein [Catalinimonas niigatensis]WPP50397.1 phosphatidylinositol-specific phospholipase C/glycerophosphodiester phosphodiesterase family protein [Catalinimonas niigatensis]
MKKLLIVFLFFSHTINAQVVPLPHAHAHNDYAHARPLMDALSYGFTSVEADVLLIDGELYVGHDMPQGNHSLPTLEEAYLQPLQRVVHNHRGKVYPDYEGDFYLMLDFKTDAEATYTLLKEKLADYQSMLTYAENGEFHKGAVTIFLSGNRPIATVKQESKSLVAIDGRPDDLGKNYASTLMPFISQHFRTVVNWDGEGDIPAAELQKLTELTAKAHAEDKKVRLWASPENEKVWQVLMQAEADLINTDKLSELRNFLINSYSSSH